MSDPLERAVQVAANASFWKEQAARIAEAERRGYRRGVQDALVRCDMEMHNGPFPFDAAKQEAHQWTAKAIRSAILALLEQTEPGEKK